MVSRSAYGFARLRPQVTRPLLRRRAISTKSNGNERPTTGRACRIHCFGAPEVISLEEVAIPAVRDGEVLVRAAAAGVGPWDSWIRAGRSALPQPLPLTLGSDLSGTVLAVGSGVTDLAVGDRVFGVTNKQFTGADADYAIAVAKMIARTPAGLEDLQAAAIPVVATTAWQALFDEARLTPGQTVLVHGAAGSVGSFAVQLAHCAGIRVIATAKPRDVGELRRLGVDIVIDTAETRFEDVVDGVDAVIDLVGADLQDRSFSVLKRGGSLISTVSPPDQVKAVECGVQAKFLLVDVTVEHLSRIGSMIADGMLRVSLGEVLPLRDARVAHEMLDGKRARPRGKIVLRVREE